MKYSKKHAYIFSFTKILIIALFVLLPLLGFYLGRQSSLKPLIFSDKDSTKLKNHTKFSEDKVIFDFISNTSSYSTRSSSVNFTCYNENSLPDNPKINQLQEELSDDQRIIHTVCVNKNNDKIMLVSADKTDGRGNTNNLLIELLDFYEPAQYRSEYVFQQPEQIDQKDFKLLDWQINGDIIFWLRSNSLKRQLSYIIETYIYNSTTITAPQLLEYCDTGIAPGTAERGIRNCKRFINSQTSAFFTQNDLP